MDKLIFFGFGIMEGLIDIFLDSNNYDVRTIDIARWIDQKCTPDVINIVADCVLFYIEENNEGTLFNMPIIRDMDYSRNIVEMYYSKPRPDRQSNEYDKFFGQPLELFAFSNVLHKEKKGRFNWYKVNNLKLLKNIANNERFAYKFLIEYISKVLHDSDIKNSFDNFFTNQTQEQYVITKLDFTIFTYKYTNIKNDNEVWRIFTKVLNPLACFNNKLGTYRGRISKEPIEYSELLYRRRNFRDIYTKKPKNKKRKEWMEEIGRLPENVLKDKSRRAKKYLKDFNNEHRKGYSEAVDEHTGIGDEAHHIFMESRFRDISYYFENIIILTPTQHYTYAHPNHNTQITDPEYQKFLLLEKSKRIQENILDESIETIYSFDKLIEVINEGFNKDYDEDDNTYYDAISIINECYSEIL